MQEQKSELVGIYDEDILADFDNVVTEVTSQKREKEEQRLQVYNQLGERLDEQENFSENLDELRKQYEARSAELKTLDHELEATINTLNEHIQTFTEHTKNIREKIEKSQEGLEKIHGLAGEATNEAEQVKWNTLIEKIENSIKEKQENFNANMAELTKMEEELQSKQHTKENVSQQRELYNKHIEDLEQRSSEIKTVVEKEQDDRAEKEVSTEDQALDYMIHGISSEEESLDNILYFLDQNFAAHGISLNESTAKLAGRTLDAQEKFAELGRIIREKGPEKADVENALQDTVDHIGTVEAQKVQETFIEVLYNEHVNVTSEQEEDNDVDGIGTELNSDTVNPEGENQDLQNQEGNTRDVESVQETAYNTEDQGSEEQEQQNETPQRQEESNLEPESGEQVKKMISILGEDWESRNYMKVVKAEQGEDGKKKSEIVPLPKDPKEKIDYVLNVQKKEQQDQEGAQEVTYNTGGQVNEKEGQQNPEAAQGQETHSGTGNEYEELELTEEQKQRVTEFLGDNWDETNQIQVDMGPKSTMTIDLPRDVQEKVNYILNFPETYTAIKQEESNSENESDERVETMKELLGENWEYRTVLFIRGKGTKDGKDKLKIYNDLPPGREEKIEAVLDIQKKEEAQNAKQMAFERPLTPSLTQEEITQADAILKEAKDGEIIYGGTTYTLPGSLNEDRKFVLDLKKNGADAAGNSEDEHHQDLQNPEGAPQALHNTGEQSKEGQPQSRRNGEPEANDQPVSTQEKDSGNEKKDETLKDQENQEDQEDQEDQVEKMKVLLGENWESRSFMNIKGQDGYKEHATYFLPPDPDERIKYVLKTHKNFVEKVLSERPSDSSLTQEEIDKADKILEKAKKEIVTINDQPYLLPSDRDDQRWFVFALGRKKQGK